VFHDPCRGGVDSRRLGNIARDPEKAFVLLLVDLRGVGNEREEMFRGQVSRAHSKPLERIPEPLRMDGSGADRPPFFRGDRPAGVELRDTDAVDRLGGWLQNQPTTFVLKPD